MAEHAAVLEARAQLPPGASQRAREPGDVLGGHEHVAVRGRAASLGQFGMQGHALDVQDPRVGLVGQELEAGVSQARQGLLRGNEISGHALIVWSGPERGRGHVGA